MRSKVSQLQHEIKTFHNKFACFLDVHASVHGRLWQTKARSKNKVFHCFFFFFFLLTGNRLCFQWARQSRSLLSEVTARQVKRRVKESRSHLCDPSAPCFFSSRTTRIVSWHENQTGTNAPTLLRPRVLKCLTLSPLPPTTTKNTLLHHPNSFPLSLMFLKWAFQLHIFLAIQFYKAIIPGVMWRLNISGQTLCENN